MAFLSDLRTECRGAGIIKSMYFEEVISQNQNSVAFNYFSPNSKCVRRLLTEPNTNANEC